MLPPPVVVPPPKPRHPKWPYVLGAVAVLIGIGSITNRDRGDDDGGRRLTLTQAACGMLDDGDDREFVYDVLKDLAADHPSVYGDDESIAARAALDRALAQGCG